MPRPVDHEARQATIRQIKAIARQHMREGGAAAVSLRAIARDLDVTAPALYRYFPTLDDLITALIVDAFTALADAVDAADAAHPSHDYAGRVQAAFTAYRGWALAHPVDFQLIYGTPIPGYHAPGMQTTPIAVRPLVTITRALAEAHAAGQMVLPADLLTPHLETHMRDLLASMGYAIDPRLLYITTAGWVAVQGIILLHLFGHLAPSIGDVDGFFDRELRRLLADFGLVPSTSYGDRS